MTPRVPQLGRRPALLAPRESGGFVRLPVRKSVCPETQVDPEVSQTALAEAIGVTFQQIQKYERGFNRVSFSRLVDIAHAFDCRVVDLIGAHPQAPMLSITVLEALSE